MGKRLMPSPGTNAQARAASITVGHTLTLTAPMNVDLRAALSVTRNWTLSPVRIRRLHTAYYDTDDFVLTRSGIALRHRAGAGWTVELPSLVEHGLMSRVEYVFAGSAGSPPSAALDVVMASVRNRRVGNVADLRTIRQSCTVSRGNGEVIAEIAHEDVRIIQDRRTVRRFAQIEIKRRAGTGDDVLIALASALRKQAAGDPDPVAQNAHALGPRALEPGEVTVPVVGRGASVADVVRHAIAASTEALLRCDPHIRLDEGPQWIHESRVATRRLRSILRMFAPIVDPTWSAALRTLLRALGDQLGWVRDKDVLLGHVESLAARLPADDRSNIDEVLASVRDSRRSAYRRLISAMREESYLVALERLVDAARDPKFTPKAARCTDKLLGNVVARSWRKLSKAVRRLNADPADDELHAVRLKVKRCRYALEAAAPTSGARAWALLRQLVHLQDILGTIHDAIVERERLRACVDPGRLAFVAGEVAGLELAVGAGARAAWHKAWRRASRKRSRLRSL